MEYINKLASAIYNDVVSGLRGYTTNNTMSIELLEDEVIETRLSVIKEYQAKGLLPYLDLMFTIRCIPIDCKGIDYCPCGDNGTPAMHFEIPQILTEFGGGIIYVGSTDLLNPFLVYTNGVNMNLMLKYRRRGKNRPYVLVDTSPNVNNMCDCWVFNAPLLKKITVLAVFKDPRQLDAYECCTSLDVNNLNFIDTEVKRRLTELKIKYYRQLAMPILPNDLTPR